MPIGCNGQTLTSQEHKLFANPELSLSPNAKGIDEQGKCRRWLPAARIVQVISRKRRTPVRQDPNKLTIREIRLHVTFRQVSQAEAFQGRVKQRASAIED